MIACETMQARSKYQPRASVEASNKIRAKELPKFHRQKQSKSRKHLVKESPSKVLVENWREVVESTVGVPAIPESLYMVRGRSLSYNMTPLMSMSMTQKKLSFLPEVRSSMK
jgi:hypothetical protein